MSTTQQDRTALRAMYVGVALTVAAAVAPYVDHVTANVLSDHVRHGYPTYKKAQVDSAVTTWLVILSVIGALGVASWTISIWATKSRKTWSRAAATALFALGTAVALTTLLTKDTSGEAGLAPVLGWIGVLPCLAGLVVVMSLWRRSAAPEGVVTDQVLDRHPRLSTRGRS